MVHVLAELLQGQQQASKQHNTKVNDANSSSISVQPLGVWSQLSKK
jgi:hypothetical protein